MWGFMQKAPDLTKFPQIPARSDELPLKSSLGRNYAQRLKDMVHELREIPGLVIEACEVGEPASSEEMDNATGALPWLENVPGMVGFYATMNGFQLQWRVEGRPARLACGKVMLLPLLSMVEEWAREKGDFAPFDRFAEYDAHCSVHVGGGCDGKVFYESVSNYKPKPLNVSFDGYLELLIESRGFLYWPLAIVADQDGQECTVEPANFRRGMRSLFGETFRPGFFLQRWEELVKKDLAEEDQHKSKVEELAAAFAGEGVVYTSPTEFTGEGYIEVVFDDSVEGNLAKAVQVIKNKFDYDAALLESGSIMQCGGYLYRVKG
ncbi:hypothetical protein DIPPA_32181 [Diplonema papillatum]|nr:hypothetical protein DIPPA_32181 [Diplonema papillatum]